MTVGANSELGKPSSEYMQPPVWMGCFPFLHSNRVKEHKVRWVLVQHCWC